MRRDDLGAPWPFWEIAYGLVAHRFSATTRDGSSGDVASGEALAKK